MSCKRFLSQKDTVMHVNWNRNCTGIMVVGLQHQSLKSLEMAEFGQPG